MCLLSSENFHTIQDPSRVLSLCPAGETRIVVYIREHAAHIVSWYQQAIQSRNTAMSLDEFIEHHTLSLSGMIDGWVQAYGIENVIVRLYERPALRDGDIVADFCHLLDPRLARNLGGQTVASNPSIAGNLLFLKRVLNCFLTKEESQSVADEVAGLSGLDPTFSGKIAVGQNTINRIKFLCREDRAQLNERFSLKMKPRTTPIEGTAYPDYSRLAEDLKLIRKASREKKFKLESYLERMHEVIA
ncbi:hypothetical protein LA6_006170 (plasmid) [Marinibacterium anthonyi]|nr:hypothetical protein LA6_006170 [Marinibacterium anthonyi]